MRLYAYEKKHNAYLRENGAECTVLLKKDGHFPLKTAGEIAAYGNGVRNTIKGGSGSGEVNSRFFVTVEAGLKNAGFTITSGEWLDAYDAIRKKEQKKFIAGVRAEAKAKGVAAYSLGMGRTMQEPEYELPIGKGDTAIYVVSRLSGESSDRKRIPGDVFLTAAEKRDILTCNRNYKNFLLVINAGGVVDLSEVAGVKNILVLSQLGVETGDILADILLGKSNPSGKLASTWTAVSDYPAIGDFGDVNETHYTEGVYVGYRYFDSVGKRADYPFGFGLSFTEFAISDYDVTLTDETVSVSAAVKNIGKYAGKEALQLYVSVPSGELDQPFQSLAGFAKTSLLAAGEEERVTVSFDLSDIASYDAKKAEYILEAGDYVLRLGNSSVHTEVAGILTITTKQVVLGVKNVLGDPGFSDYVPERNVLQALLSEKTPAEVKAAAKHITFDGTIKTVSPAYDQPEEIAPVVEELTKEQIIALNIGAFNMTNALASEVGNSGFSVAGAAGQTTIAALNKGIPSIVMADGPAGVRISRKYALDENGVVHTMGATLPDSMVMFMSPEMKRDIKKKDYKPSAGDKIKHQYATAIPIGTAIAQTFNTEFAYECGRIVGSEMKKFGVQLWLAPALNIHRSILCGRNFEYYSEDPIISGEFTAAITNGVQSYPGCGVTIKHYAANNQETNRVQSNSRVSERAMREIYLKGFGIAVRKSNPAAVMTSYNLLNGVHTSEQKGLLEDILRAEYGHKRLIMTDWNVGNFGGDGDYTYPLANPVASAAAGDNLYMPGGQRDYDDVLHALETGELSLERLKINASYVANCAKELCD